MAAPRFVLPWLALAAVGALVLALATRGGGEGAEALLPLTGESHLDPAPSPSLSSAAIRGPGGGSDALEPSAASAGRTAGGSSVDARIGDPVGALRGRVRYAETGLPAANLCFWLEQRELWSGGSAASYVETDAEGRFVTGASFRRAQVEVGRAESDCGSGDRRFEILPRVAQATGARLELFAHGPRIVLHVRVQEPDGGWVPRPQLSLVPASGLRPNGFVHRVDGTRFFFDQDRQLFENLALSSAEHSVFLVFDGQLRDFGARALLRSHSGPQLRFGTGDALSLEGLSGEVHHTFQLCPRPRLRVRLLDSNGEFDPSGMEAIARFASGDEALAEFARGRRRWEFQSGWSVPGVCDVLLVGAASRRVLAERRVTLRGGEEHLVDFERAELPLLPGDGQPFVALAGRVIDEGGVPLDDIELDARWAVGRRTLFSGPDGEFHLTMHTRVGPITLSIAEDVAAGRFEPTERTVAFGTRGLEFQRVGRDEVSLRLRLVDAKSQETLLGLRHVQLHRAGALPRVDVGLLDCDSEEPWLRGSYAPDASARYLVRVPHFRTERGALPRTGVAGERDLVLPLARGFREDLLVVGAEDGRPLAGVQVRTFEGAALGTTGVDGRAALQAQRWPEGLVFELEGYRPQRWRLDWEGLCAGVAGRIELSRRR